MRNYFSFITLFCLSYSCNNKEIKTTLPTKNTDSVASFSIENKDPLKKIMDSILAANPSAQISIESSHESKINLEETKYLNSSTLKILNSNKLDSLILSSDKKYTVVHFWATWCVPCRKEFPDLIKHFSQFNNTDVILISCDYNSDEQRKKVIAVYKNLNTTFPVYLNQINDKADGMGTEAQQKLIRHFGLNSNGGLPFNLVIENKTHKVLKASSNYTEIIEFLTNF